MLHAFNQKNVRRVLAHHAGEHKNEKTEDAITSMVFSPLAFMGAGEACQALSAIVGQPFLHKISGRIPTRHNLELWPSLLAPGHAGDRLTRCEPDLVATFYFDEGDPVAFIGEMKWDWNMSDEALSQEIRREVIAVRRDRASKIIPFVVSKFRNRRMIEGAPVLKWMDVADRLYRLEYEFSDSGLGHWAKQVRIFLAKVDIAIFSGFPTDAALPEFTSQDWAFWRPV